MERPIVTRIKRMFERAFEKEWYETYWAMDLHGTIILPNHKRGNPEMVYYPYAKEAMQMMSDRADIKLFTYTASYPEEIANYLALMKADGIYFDYINENPEISEANGHFGNFEQKPYFDVLFEDKAGFDPLCDWKPIYELLIHYEDTKQLPDPNWCPKF